MIFTRLFGSFFRLAELIFAAIVAGITGHYLHLQRDCPTSSLGRFIYIEVAAGLSLFLALLWLLPFASAFIHWPTDLVLSVAWFVVFGLLVDFLGDRRCGDVFDWSHLGFRGNSCATWKADAAFAFLSAICWLVSAILGVKWVRKHVEGRGADSDYVTDTLNRRWYRRSRC